MLAIYYGEDDYSRAAAIRAARARLGDSETANLNATTLAADSVTPAEAIAQAGAAPFLAAGRLVVIEGLLAQFAGRQPGRTPPARREPARARNRRAAQQQQFGNAPEQPSGDSEQDRFRGWGALYDAATNMPPTNVIMLSDGAISDSNPLLKHLTPRATVKQFPALRGGTLADWIQKKVTDAGAAIQPPAVNALADAHGSNLWAQDAEIQKLALYTNGARPITLNDVRSMVDTTRDENIFTMVDDVIAGRYAQARSRLQRLIQDTGVATLQVFAMLGTQIRRLIAAKDLSARRASRREQEDGIGTRSDFAIRKTLEQSRRFTMPQLLRMHQTLLEYDLSIKTGELTEETALELLIADLCGVGATPAGARPGAPPQPPRR